MFSEISFLHNKLIQRRKENMTKQSFQIRVFQILVIVAISLFVTCVTWAQTDTTPKKQLKSPATVKSVIGGEAHNSYVIHATKGQTMTVQISWQRDGDNRAEFTVSTSANFFNGESVKFGKESMNGKQWSGKTPKSGKYYIYVVAHPTAKYILKVTVK